MESPILGSRPISMAMTAHRASASAWVPWNRSNHSLGEPSALVPRLTLM